jgi:RNA polymerase sigma-70 factor, ECF subfamily
MRADQAADPYALEQFREYLNILASQQAALRFKGKGDLSGVVQQTLWEAHQQLERGVCVGHGERLAWLRRILANNLADAVRKMQAAKRDVRREVSIQQSVEESSQRLEGWLAREMPPHDPVEQEESVLQLIAAVRKLSVEQREVLVLHYWSDLTLAQIADHVGRTRDSVASLIKRGVRQLRVELN